MPPGVRVATALLVAGVLYLTVRHGLGPALETGAHWCGLAARETAGAARAHALHVALFGLPLLPLAALFWYERRLAPRGV
ncbi:MAG TPA: hypothetical protein VMD91_02915 [Candidatus Sulfotelmatobacter sp.]|nr:hypothetical protein [Candidatus Sulfotelmatobacter sp.]